MAYVLLQPFGASAWIKGDGTTTAVPVNLNASPFNIPSSHTVVAFTITDPLAVYTITNTVTNSAAGIITVTCTPAVTLNSIVQFNYSGFYI